MSRPWREEGIQSQHLRLEAGNSILFGGGALEIREFLFGRDGDNGGVGWGAIMENTRRVLGLRSFSTTKIVVRFRTTKRKET